MKECKNPTGCFRGVPDDLVVEINAHMDSASRAAFSRTSRRFAGLRERVRAKIRTQQGVAVVKLRLDREGGVISLGEFNGLLVVGGWDEITLWNEEGECVKRLSEEEGKERRWGWVSGLVEFDGKLAAGSEDGKIRLWTRDWTCVATLSGHSGWVWCLCVFGDLLTSGSDDSTIKLWDKAGTCVTTLSGHSGGVLTSVVFEGLLASCSRDGSIKLWDASGTCVRTLTDHEYGVRCLCVFAGLLVSGSWDTTLRFWDSSGTCVKVLGHPHRIIGLASSGDLLVSACEMVTKIWNAEGKCLRTIARPGPSYGLRPLLFWKGMLVENYLAEKGDTQVLVWK